MLTTETPLEGVRLLEPRRFGDDRGWFAEVWNARTLGGVGIFADFVQDNESFSRRGVLRGLHFQKGASAQAKLVRAVCGSILDVVVDLRSGSPTFGRHWSTVLSGENGRQLYIPRGFAHGFAVVSEAALVAYKCDAYYDPAAEGSIDAFDPALGIDWGGAPEDFIRSGKDRNAPSWAAYAAEPAFCFGAPA